jgi:lipopolysaccharide transport system permease protein
MLAIYTLAFGYILQVRWGGADTKSYALVLFAGLIVFNFFTEILTRAPLLIAANPNFVKKVIFPLELLPVAGVLAAAAHAGIGLVMWGLAHWLLIGVPPVTVIAAPVVLLCLMPFLIGVGWLLSALGVVVRDVNQFAAMLGQALLFLSPVFYSVSDAPAVLRSLIGLNPVSLVIEQMRVVLFQGHWPDWSALGGYVVVMTLFALLCLALFRRLRPLFADLV